MGASHLALPHSYLHAKAKHLAAQLSQGRFHITFVWCMQLIQKLSGRPGATTHAPAPLQQQAPWHSQGQHSSAQYQQPSAGYSQGHQTGFAPQQQAQLHAQQPAAFQQGQQQAWGGQQASEPAQQGCGGFVKSLLGLFGK